MTLAQARQALSAHLLALPFHSASPNQEALQAQYIDWAAGVLCAREQAFGPGTGYAIDHDMTAHPGDAVLPALYDSARQFVSSATRSPSRNAVVAATGPGRGDLKNDLDPAVVGGVVGGVTAYMADAWLLKAADRRAALANFPALKPVSVKALVPDPGPVSLRIVEGAKHYWQPTQNMLVGVPAFDPAAHDAPTAPKLQDDAIEHRESLSRRQAYLDGKGLSALAPPVLTGAANTVRRAVSTTYDLTHPLPILGSSMLASGSAGALGRFAFGMAKATPGLAQAEVSNLVGGRQTVNLYTTHVHDPAQRPADWSDLRGLPRVAGETLREALALAGHSMDVRRPVMQALTQAGDGLRFVWSNTCASVFAAGAGPLFAQLKRSGQPTPAQGERLQSGAYLLHQFGQSMTNDLVWQAVKELFKKMEFDLAGSLDRHRDDRQARFAREAAAAQTQVQALAGRLIQMEAGSSAPSGTARAAETNASLQLLSGTSAPLQIAALRRAHQQLGGLQAANASTWLAKRDLLHELGVLIRRVEQHDALVRWRTTAAGTHQP